MVYDATKSGLNKCTWAPSVHLPSVDAHIRVVDQHSWMWDLDLGDMFLNFLLDIKLSPYCGIHITPYTPEARSWERWVRCMMGLRVSPYFTIKATHIALETVFGDRRDPGNVFHWSHIVCNLPGQTNYNLSAPKLWKFNLITGKMAAAVLKYVDDLHIVAPLAEQCWQVVHKIGVTLAALGIQVAVRKMRPPTLTPGPWAGMVVWTSAAGVCVKTTKEKWVKAKLQVQTLTDEFHQLCTACTAQGIDHGRLESTRGFLVHMQQVYPSITPYLKGIHLTLDSWRGDRDVDGWRVKNTSGDRGFWSKDLQSWVDWEPRTQGPRWVSPVPCYGSDLNALTELLSHEEPPVRLVRKAHIHMTYYGFVDASSHGFGSSFLPENGISYTYGMWGQDDSAQSSNYRELNNLVTILEDRVRDGSLVGSEVYLFTDNTTAERAFYKGNTSSKTLFDLVLRLRSLEMSGLLLLTVIHLAGTRMMSQGTDGLLRGDLCKGVVAGPDMLIFVPLHLGAIERQPDILGWVQDWTGQLNLHPLDPEDWFDKGHGTLGGTCTPRSLWHPTKLQEDWYLWSPAPAAADVAVDELQTSRHKRTHLNHVVIIPRIHTHTWRKSLYKVCDLVFEIPSGCRGFWPPSEHEPLIVGLTLHFMSRSSWQLRQCPALLDLAGKLQSVWTSLEGAERSLMHQLSCLPGDLESM
jgi:hypothetical protein